METENNTNVLETVERIRSCVKSHGRYRLLSKSCGVGYEWLAKFAVGNIKNPTIDNVSKLESYFSKKKITEKASQKP